MNKQKKSKITAIITACGRGQRMDSSEAIPKQYLKINHIPILRYTILAFLNNPQIEDILCIIHPDDKELYYSAVEGIDILDPVIGGETRQKSILNGLIALSEQNKPDFVLIHDAVRPFISKKIIDGIIEKLQTHPAVIPAIAVEDTIKKIDDGKIEWTLERKDLWRAQTPQGFVFDDIFDSHKAFKDLTFTDDAAINEYAGIPVAIVPGSQNNFKITTLEDYERAKDLARSLSQDVKYFEFRCGTGFDVHQIKKVNKKDNKIRLGGIDIEFDHEIIAHSDGDVVLHAIIDALFGAIGQGDIGQHFSDSDSRWRNVNSRDLLQIANEMILEKSAEIINIDTTIICQAPKISPYKIKMQEAIANMLKISVSRINIKATTTEMLGFLGRGEGIACQAVVSIKI